MVGGDEGPFPPEAKAGAAMIKGKTKASAAVAFSAVLRGSIGVSAKWLTAIIYGVQFGFHLDKELKDWRGELGLLVNKLGKRARISPSESAGLSLSQKVVHRTVTSLRRGKDSVECASFPRNR